MGLRSCRLGRRRSKSPSPSSGETAGAGAKGDAPRPRSRAGDPGTEFCVDIVVKGRKTEVPERFRKHVAEKLKLEKIQKLDGKVISLDVEVSKEPNPRQADRSDRVEITLHSRGPVIRAEASAADPYAALDLASDKLEARLRKQHDKRYTRRGSGRLSAAEVADVVPGVAQLNGQGELVADETGGEVPTTMMGSIEVQGEGPLVVREKTHRAAAMGLDQALYEMELVGHDFYLFVDAETKQPSVVYRRHAYDYGVIHLENDPLAENSGGAGGALGG
ncbi:ribosome-associated translation inhibitor RaiA [Streptomyces hydrogenans]